MFRRGIFRRMNKFFKTDGKYHDEITVNPFLERYLEVLEWAKNTETVYENSHQRGQKKKKNSGAAKQAKAANNVLSCVAYKYSKSAMERFFRDDRLYELFKKYAPKIKADGYKTCENRRDNRVDCKKSSDSSDISASKTSSIEGHSVVVTNYNCLS